MTSAAEFSLEGKRVWVAGHRGMVGGAVVRRLASEGCEVVTVGRDRVDLRDQGGVRDWLVQERPQVVVLAAAKVGGILANDSLPVDFLLDNLLIEAAIISGAHAAGVEKLLFLGSSCIYPKFAAQPIVEEALLTGPLEPTNEWYAIAKIAGIKLAQAYRKQYGADYISAMPTNLYGPGDNYDLQNSHVLPALIRKMHEAKLRGSKEMVVWGTGTPRREFLYSDDMADACLYLMNLPDQKFFSLLTEAIAPLINIGCGKDQSILELAELVKQVVEFGGKLVFDTSKPDGTPRKLLDVSKIGQLGWKVKTELQEGIKLAYVDYLAACLASHKIS